MKDNGCSVLVSGDLGDKFICTLDSSCSLDRRNKVSRLDGNRKIPTKLEELSAHERRSCRDLGPKEGE